MTGLGALVMRNVKLYFKDKGMFLTSLITPVVLLVLYVTFLRNVFEESFRSSFEAFGATIPDDVVNGLVGGQLVSSMLAVSCVTVAFCSNLLSVQDKINGARRDINVSPVKPATVALGYFMSTFISSIIISFSAVAVCFVYLACTGWYLSLFDVVLLLADVVLLVLFGTSLSSCVIYPLTTQGQASAVGTIVSAGYGFICGAYMPMSNFSRGLRNIMSFLPGTYGTALIRNHAMNGVFGELKALGVPDTAITELRTGVDCNIFFFDNKVETGAMYAVVIGSSALLIAAYIIMNVHAVKRTGHGKTKKSKQK